jgi:hypothetical protein
MKSFMNKWKIYRRGYSAVKEIQRDLDHSEYLGGNVAITLGAFPCVTETFTIGSPANVRYALADMVSFSWITVAAPPLLDRCTN